MIALLLGVAALVLLLGAARGFGRAQVDSLKALLFWLAALGGLYHGTLLLLTGRGAAALAALAMFGPLAWSWWRQSQGRVGRPRAAAAAPESAPRMTRAEALQVLGLAPGASVAEVRAAHRRLIEALHPDRGGSDWLAARINAARDVLSK